MAAQVHVDVGGLARPDGKLDAATALEPYQRPLTQRLAAHLLRRAGFGGSPEEVQRYSSMSVAQAVDSLIHFPQANVPPPELFDRRTVLLQIRAYRGNRQEAKALLRQVHQGERRALNRLRVWWLNRMLTTPAPLQEKMTLYFHGHFTTYVDYSPLVYRQNELFRRYAVGNLRSLVHDVSKDAAMLIYLNNDSNVASHPNENYARELMELFTLGVGHYTERDVRESARAWTGWRFNRFTQQVHYDPRLHDDGVKTFLGRTGNFDGDDIVDIIFQRPECARFFAANLLNYFVYNNPEPELVDAVADLLRRNDYELAPALGTLFSSNVFYGERAYRALVKSPAEYVVGTYKALGLQRMDSRAAAAMGAMGQVLFRPPNVAGWPGGQNWLSSGTMVARQNFLAHTIDSQTLEQSSWLGSVPMQPKLAADRIVATLLQRDAAPAAVFELQAQLAGAGTDALAALSAENYQERIAQATALAMAMPAYQLN
jgi:hypothetical protein